MKSNILAKTLLALSLVLSVFILFKIKEIKDRAFNDAKTETRLLYALEEAKTGIVEFRLTSGAAIDSNSCANKILGYGDGEIKGIMLSNMFPSGISEIDFKKHPPTKVYICDVARKDGGIVRVYVRAITSIKSDRVFFVMNEDSMIAEVSNKN